MRMISGIFSVAFAILTFTVTADSADESVITNVAEITRLSFSGVDRPQRFDVVLTTLTDYQLGAITFAATDGQTFTSITPIGAAGNIQLTAGDRVRVRGLVGFHNGIYQCCGEHFEVLEVVGDADNGAAGIRKALKLRPDVVIMDLMMPEMDGTEATRELLAKWPEANVLILTTFGMADSLSKALEAGAKGAILKNVRIAELRKAIATVASGERYVAEEIELSIASDPPIPVLSDRQQQILQSIARGLTNAEIAKLLDIGSESVKTHINQLLQKIGAANRTEAVTIALRKQLIKL